MHQNKEELQGTAVEGGAYAKFKANIGGDINVWFMSSNGQYPIIEAIDFNAPSSTIPTNK